MVGHAKKCVERYCELANKSTQQLYKVSTPCIDDHHFKEEETNSVGELSNTCSQIVLKCLYLARIGRPDIFWSVNKLARSITKWTKACDKRLNRLISKIHHTSEYKQYCHLGNTAKQCRLGLFQDSDFARDLEDSKSTSGGTLCIFGSHTFVPISWMCKKQTSVSHSSTESEIISLDTGLRLDGLPALELWDLIVSVLGNVSRVSDGSGKPESDVHKRQKSHNKIDVMKDIDLVPSNVKSANHEALLYVFEDNEAVIKMIIKGRRPTMRHVSRTHRVALDWLFDRINLDPKIQIKYIDTKNQLADILTKGSFTRDEWNHLLTLFNISHFSSTACIAAMAKRAQQESGEGRVTAKSRPMMNLTARTPWFVSSSASANPGETSYGHHEPEQPVLDDSAGRPVEMSRSNYSQDYGSSWSSQVWKSGNGEHDRSGKLLHISHFSSTACTAAMAKRAQQYSGEERVTAKSRPMMKLTARMPSVVSSSTSVSPGKRYCGNKILVNWLLQMKDQGNLIDSFQQIFQNWIMTVLGLLESGKVRLQRTIDQGNLTKLLGIYCKKLTLIVRNLFSAEMRIPQGTER